MYVPKNMELSNSDAITSLISGYGFGLLISPDMETTRLPLLYESGTESSSILGHMARANPQWRDLSGKRVSVVFNGPHSYISPRWYVSKPAVPTWNYASVQCFGIFQELNSIETLSAIYALIRKYEPELMGKEELMPSDYIDKLLKAVVGFKVVVSEIHAKEKLGQHKNPEDQHGVFHALRTSPSSESKELADYMQKRGLGIGS